MGIRSSVDISLPVYLSSQASSASIIRSVLNIPPEQELIDEYSTALDVWTQADLSVPSVISKQRCWDNIRCQSLVESFKPTLDQHCLACLEAASQPKSGAWLNALPSSSIGTLLDDDSLRIGVAIRLGLRICESHTCRCGSNIDEFGLHPLSCRFSAGRFPRHAALNDVVKRGLEAAGFPSQLEPVGLDRGDGKRPDGITLFPFKNGKALLWDATCTDTFSRGNLLRSATAPGSAALAAEEAKSAKYASFEPRFLFCPVAVETSGVLGPRTFTFLQDLGRLASRQRSEPRETEWLFERISLAIIRGNAHAILSAGKGVSE